MTEMANRGGVPEFDRADRLQKALEYGRVSVQQMADELDVSRNTVGNYLGRRTSIPRPSLILWAQLCGVRPEWLEHGASGGAPTPGPGRPSEEALDRLTRRKISRARHAEGSATPQYQAA